MENMMRRCVYTLYGDVEALGIVIRRLVENSFAFHFTGEFLYDYTPWDDFITAYCADLHDRLVTRTELWGDQDAESLISKQ